jgi:hypothetical protein
MGYQLPVVREPQTVYEFENGRQFVRASINLFRGKVLCDIRVWFEPEPGEPLRPSTKGISLLPENLGELEACIAALRKALAPATRP